MKSSLIIAIVLISIIAVVATVLGLYFGGVFKKKSSSSSPSDPTNSPINPTSGPINPTSGPGNPTSSPGNPTSSPGNPTSSPGNPTSSPGNPTSSPGNPTSAPTFIPLCTPMPTLAEPNPSNTPSNKCVSEPSGLIIPESTPLPINDNVKIYLPKVACTPVTCLESYGGQCKSDGSCFYPSGWKPLLDYPHAMATNYCDLERGGCSGALGDPRDFINNVKNCVMSGTSPEKPPYGPVDANTRFGVTANPPIMIGDSAESYDLINNKQVSTSYQGSTPYSGICYDVKGPAGRAILVPYDRCAGYCKEGCGKTPVNPNTGNLECGSCLQSPDFKPKPNCPCVGKTPANSDCCGKPDYGCGPLDTQCDWCASQNHPHFDLDGITFNTVFDDEAIQRGSGELTSVAPFKCIVPQKMPSSVTSWVPCPTKSWPTGCMGPYNPDACDSGTYIKPGDSDWPDSSNADHWCCVMGGGGGGGDFPCPPNSWDTTVPTDVPSCTSQRYIKPGDSNWPDSSKANHWCCINDSGGGGGGGGGSGDFPCPPNSWDTTVPTDVPSCTSQKYIKPGDSNWPNSSNAKNWCCVSGPSKNEVNTIYE